MNLNKNILIGALCISLGVLGFSWFQTNKALKQERERVSHYYDLFKQNETAVDSLKNHADSIQIVLDRYAYIIDSLDAIVVTKDSKISYIKGELEKVLKDLEDVSYDGNYDYLQERYPTTDTLEYPFSGPQISMMTRELVTYDYDDSLLMEYIDVAALQEAQLAYKDEIIGVLDTENDSLNILAQDLYGLLAKRLDELQASEAEIARLKKTLKLWQGGAIGGAGFLVLILLLV